MKGEFKSAEFHCIEGYLIIILNLKLVNLTELKFIKVINLNN